MNLNDVVIVNCRGDSIPQLLEALTQLPNNPLPECKRICAATRTIPDGFIFLFPSQPYIGHTLPEIRVPEKAKDVKLYKTSAHFEYEGRIYIIARKPSDVANL